MPVIAIDRDRIRTWRIAIDFGAEQNINIEHRGHFIVGEAGELYLLDENEEPVKVINARDWSMITEITKAH